jgi:hypothetical protein
LKRRDVTIALALAVPDAIALAADTQTTWQRAITTARDKVTGTEFQLAEPILIPIGWSRMARKLFPLRMANTSYAVAVSGIALLNNRTPFSIFSSLETSYQGDGAFQGVHDHLVEGVKSELRTQLGVANLADAQSVLELSFILAGYEGNDVARPLLRVTSVYSGKPPNQAAAGHPGHLTTWQNSVANPFGCCWTGRSEFVAHIVNHTNPALPPLAGNFQGMTLADALDYVRFLGEFTCDFQRFAVMVPDCGRPVLTASLRPGKYEDNLTTGV